MRQWERAEPSAQSNAFSPHLYQLDFRLFEEFLFECAQALFDKRVIETSEERVLLLLMHAAEGCRAHYTQTLCLEMPKLSLIHI